MLSRAFGLNRQVSDETYGPVAPPNAGPTELDAIFAALRRGEPPPDADDLPPDTSIADLLIFELDRIWQNPGR